MKFVLMMQINNAVLDALTEAEREVVMNGHQEFIRTIQESGEMIGTQALGDVSQSVTVAARGGETVVTDGPFVEAKEYLGGYYLVDVETKERAVELARLIPDTRIDGLAVEVRPVMFSAGSEI
ncbi:YciI family protein [Actinokineospora enzanensis]|uniref:YciI family protein n=1 Tax=Actinokineospora enzanensis TaxID=155975 RepID=UPI00035FE32B|nr:YciI family protein [Actinokineospora enzanensis]